MHLSSLCNLHYSAAAAAAAAAAVDN